MGDVSNELSVSAFLLEFGIAIVLITALAAIWREWIRRADRAAEPGRMLDQYERVWLQFGRRAAVERAVVNLLRGGNLSLDPHDLQRVHLQGLEGASHPLEIDVLDAVARAGTMRISEICYAVIARATPYTLAQAGLIPQRGKRWLSIVPAVFIVPAIIVVGTLETADLVRHGKPVSLVVLLTIAGAGLVSWLCLPARRTRRGDAMVKQLQATATPGETAHPLRSMRMQRPAA